VVSNTAPPPKLTDLVPHIAPRPALLIWAPHGGNAETMNPTYPPGRRAHVDLGNARVDLGNE
jgi:hypothetical protein